MSLSARDNETLTRVGPGTPMGEFLRAYWHPVARSARVIAEDAPIRVRLLGENFVLFRSTDGQLGFFDEACPHRGASLALAHNAGNGLRCIFHGWKFDVGGKIAQIPTEPDDSAEKLKCAIKPRNYPVAEAGGLVWVCIAKDREPTPLPDFEFMHLPQGHVDIKIGPFRVNWLQALESVLDAAHLGQLHRSFFQGEGDAANASTRQAFLTATAPVFEIDPTPYGFTEAALRSLPDGTVYVNRREFVAPYFSLLPAAQGEARFVCLAVPHDDETSSQFFITFDPDAPLTQATLDRFWEGIGDDVDNIASELGDVHNRWGQDRVAMKRGHGSGFPGRSIFLEDFIVQESMGAIVDRTKENLGASDTVIEYVRSTLLRHVESFQRSGALWGQGDDQGVDRRRIRTARYAVRAGQNWRAIDPFTLEEVMSSDGELAAPRGVEGGPRMTGSGHDASLA